MYRTLCNEYNNNIKRLFCSSCYIGRIFKINENQLFLGLIEDKKTHYCYGYEINKISQPKEIKVKMPATLKMYESKELDTKPVVNTVQIPLLIKCANTAWEHLSGLELCSLLTILQAN